jgi:hypothetical protein
MRKVCGIVSVRELLACTCWWNSPARWTICAGVQFGENISRISYKGTMSREVVSIVLVGGIAPLGGQSVLVLREHIQDFLKRDHVTRWLGVPGQVWIDLVLKKSHPWF